MDKYEYRVKTEQMLEYTQKKQYKKAMEIADTIDWRRVKNASMLNTVSEIYEYNGEYQKSRDILFVAFDRSPGSRKIVYRLGTLALKIDDVEEASDCYEEFVRLAPKDPNQYILKYKILKAQKAPITEQIAALEDFKKAEYVEKWWYELANLYHEAGMTAECLEECDDLILWFSEGKYVYQAMELKMKYKPLTPIQQEKYDNRPGAASKARQSTWAREQAVAEPSEEILETEVPEAEISDTEIPEVVVPEEAPKEEIKEAFEETVEVQEEPEDMIPSEDVPVREPERTPITKVVKGATLKEALANGVAIANGINIEEKSMAEKDEQLRISGQMKIEEILQEWEEKQKQNAEAIEKQKAEDAERIRKEREEARRRQEAERLELERKAAEAEAARKKAEEEAARKAAEEAARKVAEEEAARKAAEEAERKAAEEEAAKIAAIEAAKKAAAESSKNKILEEKTQRLPDDILQLVEQLESRVAGPTAKMEPIPEEELDEEGYDEDGYGEDFDADEELEVAKVESLEPMMEGGLADLAEVLGSYDEDDFEDDYPEPIEENPENAEDFEEADADLEAEDFEVEGEPEEAEFDAEEFEAAEDFEDEDEYDEDDFDEVEDFEDEDEYDEDNFDEVEDFEDDEDFDEDEFDEVEDFEDDEDFDEDDFDEVEDFEDEDDFDEEEFDEDEFEVAEDFEDEYDEDDLDEEDFFDEEELPEPEPVEDEEEEIELEIEEPSEEEIQQRIKKSKGGGVPFDTGFVVTGRYDLSATSEIGLKAGLTEEQKKLFSYFVPVRGMSEQIVEVLDNDRRAQREGTSKTGNLLVIGRKGSGKTVLAVDIVKAIQKQRNLKQGKVAIVTGESLNKKELSNIIQKLRGGAIIIEKAGKLNSRTVKELSYLMEKKTGEMLFVLEDQRKPLERILTANPDFKRKFTSKLELPVFINDELVTFGQTYAKENGYKLDEMGILALYSRIDVMQREDHAVSVAEVKEIMDDAIAHSQKANVKHLARRVFGKSTDDSDRIILKEEDFRI